MAPTPGPAPAEYPIVLGPYHAPVGNGEGGFYGVGQGKVPEERLDIDGILTGSTDLRSWLWIHPKLQILQSSMLKLAKFDINTRTSKLLGV